MRITALCCKPPVISASNLHNCFVEYCLMHIQQTVSTTTSATWLCRREVDQQVCNDPPPAVWTLGPSRRHRQRWRGPAERGKSGRGWSVERSGWSSFYGSHSQPVGACSRGHVQQRRPLGRQTTDLEPGNIVLIYVYSIASTLWCLLYGVCSMVWFFPVSVRPQTWLSDPTSTAAKPQVNDRDKGHQRSLVRGQEVIEEHRRKTQPTHWRHRTVWLTTSA